MYIEQFWKYFEKTGDISTYMNLKEYETLYKEHIDTNNINEDKDELYRSELDRMK